MEKKHWVYSKAKSITDNYKNPFTGIITDNRKYAHFITFAVPLETALKCDSFELLLELISSNK